MEIRDIAISNTRLTAPFAGVLISSPLVTTGITLLSTDVFELVNPSSLVLKAAVDEADIAKVIEGQSAQIELDAFPDQHITSYISTIAHKSVESTTGTVFVVELPINGENLLDRYRLGMNGDVTITLNTKPNVMTIPLDALRERDDKSYVDVRTGPTTYEEREIKTGLDTDDKIEVIDGLTLTDEVLLPE